jgi:hypothetical protein
VRDPRRGRGAGTSGAESPGDQEDRGEHLRGQVGRRLAVAGLAQQEPDDRGEMAAVERGERRPVAGHDCGQQLPVGALEVWWHLTNRLCGTGLPCDIARWSAV